MPPASLAQACPWTDESVAMAAATERRRRQAHCGWPRLGACRRTFALVYITSYSLHSKLTDVCRNLFCEGEQVFFHTQRDADLFACSSSVAICAFPLPLAASNDFPEHTHTHAHTRTHTHTFRGTSPPISLPLFHMSVPLVASGKTVEGDSDLFFAITRAFSVPGASSQYQTPLAFNQLLRSRLRQRNRFNHDHHDTIAYIERSKNANVVAYTANLVDAATNERVSSGVGRQCVLYRDDPLHAYFVNLEPSYLEQRRFKGIEYDCDDLNILERTLAYGCSATPVNTESVLQYWRRDTPEAFAALQEEWKVCGSIDASTEDQATTDAEQQDRKCALEGSGATVTPLSANALTVESLDAALKTWWAPFHPYMSHFVALSTWPGLIMCLPPVAKMVSGQCGSVTAVGLPVPAASEEQSSTSADQVYAADTTEVQSPMVDTTNSTYGTHTEPAEATATSGLLLDEDTVVAIITRIDGELSVLEKVYVKSTEPKRFYNMPKVEYIEVFGVSLATGDATYEKKTY
ncbi:hypothetical protein, conserved [Leishmania tarentolae]|uniref:DUF4833 domain-containing protein n=1 Tax=Leishmania tarentolae TaxID=5689 RepID=A0A640KFT9_LEITA|nr:hypothetical protein, conserved [Leishmania tarentolae]